jgi:hypothetical protein
MYRNRMRDKYDSFDELRSRCKELSAYTGQTWWVQTDGDSPCCQLWNSTDNRFSHTEKAADLTNVEYVRVIVEWEISKVKSPEQTKELAHG